MLLEPVGYRIVSTLQFLCWIIGSLTV